MSDPFSFPGFGPQTEITRKGDLPSFVFVSWFNRVLAKISAALTDIQANSAALATMQTQSSQTAGTLSGLAAIASTGSASDLVAGTTPDARMPALTGDVTSSVGTVATTLASVNADVGTFGDAVNVAQLTVDAKGRITAVANVAISGGASAISALSGDVVAAGPGSAVATIQPGAVTYAKLQDTSAPDVLLGRGEGAGAGAVEELSLGAGLTMTGTVLSAVISSAYIPLTTGAEPMEFVSDGAGSPIMVPFSP